MTLSIIGLKASALLYASNATLVWPYAWNAAPKLLKPWKPFGSSFVTTSNAAWALEIFPNPISAALNIFQIT